MANFFAVVRIYNKDTLAFLDRFSFVIKISFRSITRYSDAYLRHLTGTATLFFYFGCHYHANGFLVFGSLHPGIFVERNFLNLIGSLFLCM